MTRTIAGDWYPGVIPDNVMLADGAFVETTSSFSRFRSRRPKALHLDKNSSAYAGCMFDLGPDATVEIGPWTLLNGVWVMADSQIHIGAYVLISWNVVVMDGHRAARDIAARRRQLESFALSRDSGIFSCDGAGQTPRPVTIEDNVWISFDCCILPGVHIGTGSVIGARSVVDMDIPPYCLAAGNPARVIRNLDAKDRAHG